jgi:negative regulator of replication initiation
MALKTFNLDEDSYKKYSSHCKEKGISMSKQIDKFIRQEIARIAEMPVKDVAEVPKSSKVDIQKDHHSMVKYC